MSRCAQTDRVLDAVFASARLTRSQADHAAECSECARALAHARRFDSDLHRAGTELSPEPMPAPEEVVTVMNDGERRLGGQRRRVVGILAAAGVLVVGVFLGGQWLGTALRPLVESQAASVSNAAALIGAPEQGVLVTEDGVLGVRDLGDTFELVLVRSTAGTLEEYVLDSVSTNALSVISCDDDELARGDFVWGHVQDVARVDGPGDYVIRDRQLLIFAFDRDRSPADADVEVVGRNGGMTVQGAPGSMSCLGVHADGPVVIPRPEAVHCTDWRALGEDVQLAVTRAAIFEWLVPAVRSRQHMPDAPLDELIAAARSSIDKACQAPLSADMLVPEVVNRLYGQ